MIAECIECALLDIVSIQSDKNSQFESQNKVFNRFCSPPPYSFD
jgi:hypothetical protein